MDSSKTTRQTLVSAIIKLLVGQDLEQARKRMRNAWLAGFIWSGVVFINTATAIWGLVPGTEERLNLGLFIFALVEVGIVAFLSYGVLQRRRQAATALFFYFWISRIFWITTGIIGLATILDITRFLVWQVLPAYLFFQGLRGAWTYYHLTHPEYPAKTQLQT